MRGSSWVSRVPLGLMCPNCSTSCRVESLSGHESQERFSAITETNFCLQVHAILVRFNRLAAHIPAIHQHSEKESFQISNISTHSCNSDTNNGNTGHTSSLFVMIQKQGPHIHAVCPADSSVLYATHPVNEPPSLVAPVGYCHVLLLSTIL